MKILKKQILFLGITFLMSIYSGFPQLNSDGHNQEPKGVSSKMYFSVNKGFILLKAGTISGVLDFVKQR